MTTLLEELYSLLEGQREDRLEFVKNQLKAKWNGAAGYDDLDEFLAAVAQADPSEKGVYMQWIARLLTKNAEENKAKLLPKVSGALKNFERFKNKLEKKDINTYKSFNELMDAVGQFDYLHDLEKKWPKDGIDGAKTLEDLARKAGKIDSTGKYIPWIIKLVASKPNENRVEDFDRLKHDIANFEKHKDKIAEKDIEKYKSFDDLYQATAPYLDKEQRAEIDEKAALAKLKDEITIVHDNQDGWIRIPNSVSAAQFLGQSTRWCTAAKNSNMFEHYNKTDKMFVVYDKATKKRFQLHIQSGQFCNDADTNQGVKAVPQWSREPIYQWYKKNNPQMTIKQLLALSDFTEENVAAGTDHEDLIALMKKYGV